MNIRIRKIYMNMKQILSLFIRCCSPGWAVCIACQKVIFPTLHCFNGDANWGASLFAKHCTENGRRQVHLKIFLYHMFLLHGSVQRIIDGEPNQNCLSPSRSGHLALKYQVLICGRLWAKRRGGGQHEEAVEQCTHQSLAQQRQVGGLRELMEF
jgi:sulfur relay (sulfurtransferase) complex TusBCD TusD component (DsrE family)